MYYSWHKHVLKTNTDILDMSALFREHAPETIFIDTETTGLHLGTSTPFAVPLGWTHGKYGYAYIIDLEKTPLPLFHQKFKEMLSKATVCGHNLKFDMHMLTNIGYRFTKEHYTDTMFLIRFSGDAIPERKGGPSLGLKNFTTRYIDRAKTFESELHKERSTIAAGYNKQLRAMLGMTQKELDIYKKDCIFTKDDLPSDQRTIYQQWYSQLPLWLQNNITFMVSADDIPYNMLNRNTLLNYAIHDIIYTAEVYRVCYDVCKARGTLNAVEFENKLILPLFEMERIGFTIDTNYLSVAKERMREYILQRRQNLYDIMGERVTVLQSKRIISKLNEFGLDCNSTSAETLDNLLVGLEHDSPAAELIKTVQELRTLEKWYATYIIRFEKDLNASLTVLNKPLLFTSINQVGAVSGRVSSDFQQFPRGNIVTNKGVELFSPRRMVKIAEDENYDGIVFLDYSQIELRLQAVYTLLVESPDYNMCRAYMPYDCINKAGELYEPTRSNDEAYVKQEWFLKEDPSVAWHPVDVHGATAKIAFDITEDDPNFHDLRYIGKRVNFAKNYGCRYGKIREMFPEFSAEQCHKIDEAYYAAFPGIKEYHKYCEAVARSSPYAINLFGIKYYGVSGHNLKNMLIQGSGAYFLKQKIYDIWKFSKENGVKSPMMMNIHDEIFWKKHKDDDEIFFKLQKIMQDWEGTLVPIVAEMEMTKTTWANKIECNSLQEMREFYAGKT